MPTDVSMRICSHCVLPETFPGIRFDDEGVCNFCHQAKGRITKLAEEKARYHQKFLNLLNELNELNQPKQLNQLNQRSYDVLLAYSGGKDSSYTLKLLKRDFNLRVLAITFNHGFVSEQALKNIRSITSALDVDHLMVTPNQRMLCQAFRQSIDSDLYPLKALERASSICNTCMNLTKGTLLKYAILFSIPFIAYGWSPGQAPIQSSVMKWNLPLIRQTQAVMVNTFRNILDHDLSPFFLGKEEFERLETVEKSNRIFLYNIHPLAFLDYNEEMILEKIKELGWEDPKDTDSNSTNCLLNGFANQVHQEKYGFHPYAFEIAGLVREGYMKREEGLKKLSTPSDAKIIDEVKAKLGLSG